MLKKVIAATIIAALSLPALAGERYMHNCTNSKASPTVIDLVSPNKAKVSREFRKYYEGIRPKLDYVKGEDGKSYYEGRGLFKNGLVRCRFTGTDGKVSK